MAVARLKAASLPVKKSLSGFDFSAASSIPRLALEYRPSLEWLRAKEWPCLVGPPGTGKKPRRYSPRPRDRRCRLHGALRRPMTEVSGIRSP